MSARARPLLGLLLASALLVTVVVWMQDPPGEGPAAGPATVEALGDPGSTLPPTSLPEPAASAPTPLEVAGDGQPSSAVDPLPALAPTQLLGRILRRADRSPVADVAVQAVLWSDASEGDDQERRLPLRSDDEGRFEAILPAPYGLDQLIVGAGPDTIPAVAWEFTEPAPGEPWQVEVLVDGGLQLQGRVQDRQGAPVAGARVRVWLFPEGWPEVQRPAEPDRETSTDGLGRFRLDVLGPGFVVDVADPGRRSLRLLMGRATSGSLTLEQPFVLAPERWVGVQVRDLSDRPVWTSLEARHEPGFLQQSERATALGEVHWELPAEVTLDTDEGGRGRLGPLTDEPWMVSVVDSRYPRWRRVHAPGDGPLSIVLGQGVEVTGRVTGPAGQPVAGARVEFECQTGQRGTETAADGSFRVTDVDDGPVGYGAWAPGFALRRHTHWRPGEPLPITLEPEAELIVEVVDGQGVPVEGVRVLPRAWRSDLTWIERMVPGQRLTDVSGRVTLSGLSTGEHALSLEHRPTRRRREVLVRSGSGVQQVVLEDPGRITLRGRVTAAGSGAPIPRFRVLRRLTGPASNAGFSRGFEDPDGRFSWEVPALPMSLTVSAEGHAPWFLEQVPLDEDPAPLEVRLHPVRSLVVQLRDTSGQPVRGRLTVADVGDGAPRPLRLGHDHNAWTDDDGRALIPDLPATLVEVSASNEALAAQVRERIDLSATGEQRLELVLAAGPRRVQQVVVFEGEEAVGHRAGPASPWALLSAHGRDALRPVGRAVRVRVIRPDGEQLQDLAWSAEQAGAPRRFASEPDLGVQPAELELPAEPLWIEVSVPGGEPQVAAWQPSDGGVYRSDPLVFVLPP